MGSIRSGWGQCLEAPKFSSNRECWEGVGELLDLSYTQQELKAGKNPSGSVRVMLLMSQTRASLILPSSFPHPSPSFLLLPLSQLGLCRLMSSSPLRFDVVQLPRRQRSAKGNLCGIRGRRIDADHSGLEDGPGPRAREQESYCPGPCEISQAGCSLEELQNTILNEISLSVG